MAYAGFSKGGGGGGAGNLRIMKTKRTFSPLKISSLFCPKVFFRLVENQKKGLQSDLVWFLAQNWAKTKKKKEKRSSVRVSPFLCSNFLPKLQRGGGGMPQFYMLFYANYTILVNQRGGMAPLNTPLVIWAPNQAHRFPLIFERSQNQNFVGEIARIFLHCLFIADFICIVCTSQ